MQREHVSGLAPSALVQIEGETSRQREEKWSGTEMDKRETLTASWEELEADWAKGFQIRAQRPLMMQICCEEAQNVDFSLAEILSKPLLSMSMMILETFVGGVV